MTHRWTRLQALACALVVVGCTAEMPTPPQDAGDTHDAFTPLDGHVSDAGHDAGHDTASDATSCDADGDGVLSTACGGNDCDDHDMLRNPSATEQCTGMLGDGRPAADHDEDCDPCTVAGIGPDGDADADLHPSSACTNPWIGASAPLGCDATTTLVDATAMIVAGDDCDDTHADVYRGLVETCDGRDNDCDTSTDEGVQRTFRTDADDDGFANPAGAIVMACTPPAHFAEIATDCDDTQSARNPGLGELCDGIVDNDCNPATNTYDVDMDGYETNACGGPDCDDNDAARHPGVTDVCDGTDLDCDGVAEDADGDGHLAPTATCTGSAPRDDCNDLLASVHPGAVELCNMIDDDCDGTVDGAAANASCSLPHATAVCALAGCAIASCSSTYGDCNASAGCETDLATSLTSCGACGNACGIGGSCAGLSGCDVVRSLSAGTRHACAVRGGGAVVCWGANDAGEIPGAGASSLRPRVIAGITDAIGVAAGNQHVCAVRSGGGVLCWGSDASGQVGDGGATGGMIATPTAVVGLSNAVEVAAGHDFTCARRSTGTVVCWGDGFEGQMGDGVSAATPRAAPSADVPGVSGAIAIAAGDYHACALTGTGAVLCWGRNAEGQVGSDTATTPLGPTTVVNLAGASAIAAGDLHSCAVRTSGVAACWGWNADGQIGDASMTLRRHAVDVVGTSGIARVTAGTSFSCALRTSGTSVCWGRGNDGRLGTGSTASRSSPGPDVGGITSTGALIEAGALFACVAATDGTAWCWGADDIGQLGNDTTSATGLSTAVPVFGLP